MALTRKTFRGLVIPITVEDRELTYRIPPVGVEAGLELADILTASPAKRARDKHTNPELFKLAMGDVWDQMIADQVPIELAWRAGLAALAHFQVLLTLTGPGALDAAEKVAEGVWESGLNPEALAAFMAAQSPTNRSTRRAGVRTTR